jgi:hypothetical protein
VNARPPRRLRASAVAVAASLTIAGAARAQDGPAKHPILQAVERIRAEVSRLRGLQYQAEVKVGVKTPAEIRAMVLEEFEKEAPAEEMQKQEKVYKRLGLIPQDYDLRARTIDFLAEQIGGYYDPEKKELFLVDQSGNAAVQAIPGAQAAMDDMVMAHELNHALQDQNYDLTRWQLLFGDHDDRSQGYKSIVEGDAQVIGMTYLFHKMGRGDVDIAQFNRMQEMAMRFSPDGAKMRAIPPFLLENMMFPYTQGAEFCQRVEREKGMARLDQAFRDPPSSTEQILHPEKFLTEPRDEPTELLMPDVSSALGEGATKLYENTLGEFNVTLLLRAAGISKGEANKAAAGWDGDHYEGYETKDGRTVVVLLSTWDSEQEATEFETTLRKALHGAGDAYAERRGTEVLLLEGATEAERPTLVRDGFACAKYEAKFVPLPGLLEKPPVTDFTGGAAGAAPEASQAALPPTLLRADAAGATLVPPEGWAASDEPNGQLKQMGAFHLTGPEGAQARLIRLPIALPQVDQQLPDLLKQGIPDSAILHKSEEKVLGGRSGLRVDFSGTLPHDTKKSACEALFVNLGPDTFALGVTVPDGATAAPQALVEQLAAGLWLDGSPAANAATARYGAVSFEEPAGFVGHAGQGQVVCTLEAPDGAKVQVVRTPADGSLEARGRALEAQLPLLLEDWRPHAAGVVTRGARQVHELEFEAAGRRTRQLTLDVGADRYTVACSAPVGSWTDHLAAFGRVLATFEVAGQQPAAPDQGGTQGKPQGDAPAPERKAY